MNTQAYIAKVQDRQTRVGIVGLGYVGLPLALNFVRAKFNVVASDIDDNKIQSIKDYRSYIKHISDNSISEAMETGRLHPSSEIQALRDCDAIILCVPTPLNKNREPDMSYIAQTGHNVGMVLKPGTLVVLESTTWPGTTEEFLKPIIENISKLQAGQDFALAFSPEREDPGNKHFNTQTIPKVVGGLTPECRDAACALYGAVMDQVVPVRNTQTAEMVKIYENVFRSVNIALANDMKRLCHAMENVDMFEVTDAAKTKPFGYMPFYPGPGIGGHCIPLDPAYLSWRAKAFGLPMRFIELAGEVNTDMPHYTVERISLALNEQAKALKHSSILIYGIAYKANIDDVRESPALEIIKLLKKRGANVHYHDQYVPHLNASEHYAFDMKSIDINLDVARNFDAAVIVAAHDYVNFDDVCRWFSLVIDCRNACASVLDKRNVFQA